MVAEKKGESMPRITIVLLVVVCLSSCYSKSTPETDTEDPNPTGPISREYKVPFEVAWDAVQDVLDEYSVPVELIDKENGLVKTGFMSGNLTDNDYVATIDVSRGRRWIEETRYKLELHVMARSNGHTEIQVISLIQAKCSTSSRDGSRYREGMWYEFNSTGGIELQTLEDIAAQLRQDA